MMQAAAPSSSLSDMIQEADTSSLLVGGMSAAMGVLSIIYLYQLLSGSRPKKLLPMEDFVPLPLLRKQVLSHDTVKFTLGLPSPDMVLGLPTGQHISLKFFDSDGKAVQRNYTPVSDNTTLGEIHLVIKVYRAGVHPKFPSGGKMSQHLDSLKIGDCILVKGPKGHLEWKGNGQFSTKPLGKPLEHRACSQIAMMAGGTGITPMLQLLHAIFRNPRDTTTRVNLIYANQTVDDILVRDELEALARDFGDRFSLWYTVDRAPDADKEWKYDTGFLSKEMFEKHLLFADTKETQCFMCGPPPMIKFACQPALRELGYSEKDWVVF